MTGRRGFPGPGPRGAAGGCGPRHRNEPGPAPAGSQHVRMCTCATHFAVTQTYDGHAVPVRDVEHSANVNHTATLREAA